MFYQLAQINKFVIIKQGLEVAFIVEYHTGTLSVCNFINDILFSVHEDIR